MVDYQQTDCSYAVWKSPVTMHSNHAWHFIRTSPSLKTEDEAKREEEIRLLLLTTYDDMCINIRSEEPAVMCLLLSSSRCLIQLRWIGFFRYFYIFGSPSNVILATLAHWQNAKQNNCRRKARRLWCNGHTICVNCICFERSVCTKSMSLCLWSNAMETHFAYCHNVC